MRTIYQNYVKFPNVLITEGDNRTHQDVETILESHIWIHNNIMCKNLTDHIKLEVGEIMTEDNVNHLTNL